MPWNIKKRDGKYCVVNKDSGKTEKCHSTEAKAQAHMKALYANVKDATEQFTFHGPYYLEKADSRVNYRSASMDTEERCGMCRYYSMNGCRLVEGVIEADHYCNLHTKLPVMEPGEENMSSYWYTEDDERPAPPETSPLADKFRLFMEKRFIDAPVNVPCLPKPGIYYHPYYGEIHITTERNQHFIDNFAAGVYQKQIPIDAEHETKVSGALGWITSLAMNENGSVDAVVEWTDRGTSMLAEDRFKYVSPEWYDTWTDPATQVEYTDVLVGLALCTRPFFKDDSLRPLAATEQGKLVTYDDGGVATLFDEKLAEESTMTKKAGDVTEPQPDPQPTPEPMPHPEPDKPAVVNLPQDFSEVTRRLTEMEAANASLRSLVETQSTALTEATGRLASMAEDARRKRFSDEVMGISAANKVRWVGDPDKHVSMLETLAKTLGEESEQFKEYVEGQRSTAAIIQNSALFGESGSGANGNISGDQAALDAAIKAKIAADPKLSYAQAMDMVFTETPSLHRQHSNNTALRVSGNK